MSRGPWVTPDVVLRVKDISDNNPGIFHHEIAKRVGVCDEIIRRIINNEYRIEGDRAVRIYKKPKKATEDDISNPGQIETRFRAFTDEELDSMVLAFCYKGLGSLVEEAREERKYREYKKDKEVRNDKKRTRHNNGIYR